MYEFELRDHPEITLTNMSLRGLGVHGAFIKLEASHIATLSDTDLLTILSSTISSLFPLTKVNTYRNVYGGGVLQ